MRLKLTRRVRRHRLPRLGAPAGRADGRGRAARGARAALRARSASRGRRSHGHRRPRASRTSSRVDVDGGPPPDRAAQALNGAAAARPGRRAAEAGAGRLQRALRGACALVPLSASGAAASARRSRCAARSGIRAPLDLDRLDASAALLVGEHDFRAFTPDRDAAPDLRAHGRGRALGRSDDGARRRSRSPPTRSCATWCEPSSARCSSATPAEFAAAPRGPPARPRPARPPRRGASTSTASVLRYPGTAWSDPRRALADLAVAENACRYDRAMRFPVVLFDLDGTVVDSGGIILASMRHATRTVLGREYHRRELLALSAGRGSRRRCRRWRRTSRRARPRLPRAQRAAARHARVLPRDGRRARRAEGRRAAGSGSSRPSAARPSTSRSPASRSAAFDAIVGGDETERHKPTRSRSCSRSHGSAPTPADAAYVGDSPFDMQAAQRGRDVRHRRHLGADPRPRRAHATPTSSSTPPRSCLPSSRRRARAAELRDLLEPLALRVPRPRRAVGRRRDLRPPLRRARRARGGASRARHAGLADPARRRAAVGQVPEGAAPDADGLAREGDDRRGAREVGRGRAQAPRHRRARRLSCSSRRSTASRSTSPTRTASSCAAPRAATASRART